MNLCILALPDGIFAQNMEFIKAKILQNFEKAKVSQKVVYLKILAQKYSNDSDELCQILISSLNCYSQTKNKDIGYKYFFKMIYFSEID